MNKLHLEATNRFERDLKRVELQGRDVNELLAVVDELRAGRTLAARHKPHKLKGDMAGDWECHIKHDWLLVWRYPDEHTLKLARTGTHTDVFG